MAGFGDADGNRRDDRAPRGDFAPRKPSFAKAGAPAGGAKPYVPHDARKRTFKPAR
jgi:hypothetical protein